MPNRRLPTVSVVIPTLNEENRIVRCIASAAGEHAKEVIIADGGSTDRTVSMARRCEAVRVTVARTPPGRGRQMNAGAALAGGEVFLFLHADCTLAPGALGRLRAALADRKYQAGYFRQRIDGSNPLYRLIEAGSRLRAGLLARPYGDQAMFFRRTTFRKLGGFPEVPIMEDLLLARAARRCGPFLAMPEAVTCSARRWEADGALRRILRNWSVAVAELRGESFDELLRRYQGREGKLPPPRR